MGGPGDLTREVQTPNADSDTLLPCPLPKKLSLCAMACQKGQVWGLLPGRDCNTPNRVKNVAPNINRLVICLRQFGPFWSQAASGTFGGAKNRNIRRF